MSELTDRLGDRADLVDAWDKFELPGPAPAPLNYADTAALFREARARVAELEAMLKECADDLACEIEARYDRVKDHPAMTPRYDRDMDTVVRARAVLAKGPSTSAQDEGEA